MFMFSVCPRPEALGFSKNLTEMTHIMSYERNVRPEMLVSPIGKGTG